MENFKEAFKILTKIESLGYKAYIVGGAVRDKLLGLSSFDIDIATSMPIDKIKDYFTVLDNGSSYLSVTISMGDDSYEITSFRRDISYSDHRHPEVELVDDFYTDSFRRDFTINAIALDKDNNIIDYHEGQKDLANHLIKAIGNPRVRFDEDALRILRGLYLASKLNFKIDDDTLLAMVDKKKLLSTLSDERIYSYFYRIINEGYSNGIDYINKYDLFEYIPTYKNWIRCGFKGLTKSELIYNYYLSYNKMPLNLSFEGRICSGLRELVKGGFSAYSLYKNLASYKEARNSLLSLGYDVAKYDNIISSFIINSDSELKVSKEEIASYFLGKKKSLAINYIIKEILDGNISNNREEILDAIRRF